MGKTVKPENRLPLRTDAACADNHRKGWFLRQEHWWAEDSDKGLMWMAKQDRPVRVNNPQERPGGFEK